MNDLVVLLIVIPFIASLVSLLDRYFLRLRMAQVSSIGAVCLCLIFLAILSPTLWGGEVVYYPVGGWPEPIGISLCMDGLAWITSLIGMLIALLCLVFAGGEGKYQSKFYFSFLILLGGMEGVILTGDLFNMFVFFEILSIASYILIAYQQKEKSIMASLNYLLIGSLGMGFFLLGIALLYQQTGVLSLREIARLGSRIERDSTMFTISLVSLVVGIGIKAAFMPLHTWLPDAHAYAPHPVSAILSGVMIKVSFLAIWRILRLLQGYNLQQVFMWIGGLTAFLAVVWAIAQNDSKKILAYHSISQMGYIIASFGAATSFSLAASFYHTLSHSLFKSLLFLSVGAVIYITGRREIDEMAGLGKKMPLVWISFLIGALSISGIPPFNGYVSKSFISASLKGYPFVHSLIFLASVGTVASFIKLSRIFRASESKEGSSEARYRNDKDANSHSVMVHIDHLKAVPRRMLIPLVVLSILCLITGIYPYTIGGAISKLLLGKGLSSTLLVYSPSQLANTMFVLGPGLVVHLLTTSSKGKRTLGYIRSLNLGLNNCLLLIAVGFLLLVIMSWITVKGVY
jgi:multicomponent Na+:H+ antiporter subunit D